MSKDLWNQEEEEAFSDRPDEISDFSAPPPVARPAPHPQQQFGRIRPSNIPEEPTHVNTARGPAPQRKPQVQPQQRVQSAEEQYYEEDSQEQEIDFDILDQIEEEENFEEVLNDAHLRLEQGSLYKIIMNHDLFAGMESDPKAVKNVEREIKKFARERMEVMLGMRQETPKVDQTIISSPFNDLEVDILKKLASKATNGATETPEANQVAAQVRQNAPKKMTLNTIGGSTAPKRTAPQPIAQRKLPVKAPAPLQRKQRMDATIEQIAAEEGVAVADLELNYKPLDKLPEQMSETELQERAKQTAARLNRHKTVKSASALPMATPEQEEWLATQRAGQMGQAPGMAALLERVKLMPIKNS